MIKSSQIATKGYIREVGKAYPLGKESTIQCIKDIGQYIIDNAEKIGETASESCGIVIEGRVFINSLPTVSVTFQNVDIERLEKGGAKA